MKHWITSLTLSLYKFRASVPGWHGVIGPLAVSCGSGGAGGKRAQPQAPEQGSRSHAAQSCDITDAALRTTTRHSFPSWTGPAGLRPELRPRMHRPYQSQNWQPQIYSGGKFTGVTFAGLFYSNFLEINIILHSHLLSEVYFVEGTRPGRRKRQKSLIQFFKL